MNQKKDIEEIWIEFASDKNFKKNFIELSIDTKPTDKTAAEEAIKKAYRMLKLNPPNFIWVKNPVEGCRIAAEIAYDKKDITEEELKVMSEWTCFGSLDRYSVAYYNFAVQHLDIPKNEAMETLKNIIETCSIFWCFEDVVIMVENFLTLRLNKELQLHNPVGPAIEWPDGTALYALNGEYVEDEATLILKGILLHE